jgi:hypothetical protein
MQTSCVYAYYKPANVFTEKEEAFKDEARRKIVQAVSLGNEQ